VSGASGALGNPTALLIIDVQQGLDAPHLGARNNPTAEQRMRALLAAWREAAWPVVHVQHMSTRPESTLRPELPGNAIKPEVEPHPGEALFRKTGSSAFIGTALEAHLRRAGIGRLVVIGLTTDHCVSSSVRTAANLGFEVTVVEDATATFERIGPDGTLHHAQAMHDSALASLHDEFARVLSTRAVLDELRAASSA
jgi:nicotinamidase-related amidase